MQAFGKGNACPQKQKVPPLNRGVIMVGNVTSQ
jgi:hypothetical protein